MSSELVSEKNHYHVIITVGTSIIRNVFDKNSDKHKEFCKESILNEECINFLYQELIKEREPEKISAEINGMKELLKENKVFSCTLLSSDTNEGKASAKVLNKFFESRGIKTESVTVGKLGLVFELGIENLMNEIAKAFRRARENKLRVALNLTGGYKAESAVAYLVACMLGIEKTLYIHETIRVPIELPTIPIMIEPNTLARLRQLSTPKTYSQLLSNGWKNEELERLEKQGLIRARGTTYELNELIKTILAITKEQELYQRIDE